MSRDFKSKATEIDRKRKATPQGEDEPDSKRLKCIPSIDEKTIKERYRKLKFEANVINKSTDMEEPKKQQHHVLIETVNLFEYYAAVLQLKKGCKAERYSSKGSSYLVGKWGEAEIPVVIIRTHQGKDGRRGSFNATKKAIEWLPYLKYIFAVGVCGGRKGKVNLGDVVVSRVIQDYATELKAKGGKLIDRCPHWDIANKTDFHEFLDQEADAIPGVILSGNLLMADACKQHDLVETYPDGIAFEMEGTGIARACEEMDKEKIVFMVVKGVCDLADENKDDNWQPEAALNAAKALCKAMKSYEPIASLSPVNLAEKEHKTKTRMRNQNVRKQDRSQRQVRKPRQYANHKGNLRNKGRGKGRNQRQGRGRK